MDAGYRALLAPSGLDLDALRRQPSGVTAPLETRYRKYAGDGGGDAPGFATPSRKVVIDSGQCQGNIA